MFRLRRWYNQNSKTIWKVTGIVVFLILILQLLNYFAAKNNEIEYSNTNIGNFIQKDYTDLSLTTDKSVLSNEKISSTQIKGTDVINTFFAYCNEGDIEKAYEMLSDDCKKEMYPKLKVFNDSYYKKVFNGEKKNISLENWIGNVYKVEIIDDLLSTGKYDENSTKQDYITVDNTEDNKYKLNINGYIGSTEINKTSTFYNDIQINVEKKDVYMDYEIYTFKIKNNMNAPVLLDNLINIDSMYLLDKNGLKYSAYTHEISLSQLVINAREIRELKIKYYNKYGSEKKIENIVFSRVVLNYDPSSYVQEGKAYDDFREVNIDL